jgi:hypothetical protein
MSTTSVDIKITDEMIARYKQEKRRKRKNECNSKWFSKKYQEDSEFKAKTRLRYYKKKYQDDEIVQSIIEQSTLPSVQLQQILEYAASKK